MDPEMRYEIEVMEGVKTHLEGYKVSQEATFMGRKICAQATSGLCSLICGVPACVLGCIYVTAGAFGCCEEEQYDGCVGTPKPARSQSELWDKYCDLECCCLCCQEPAMNYSVPEERRTLQDVSTKIEELRSGIEALTTISEVAATPAPLHQIMLEYLED